MYIGCKNPFLFFENEFCRRKVAVLSVSPGMPEAALLNFA